MYNDHAVQVIDLESKPLPSISSSSSTQSHIPVEKLTQPILYPTPPPTSNKLSSAQRAQLRRSANKVQRVLGGTPYLVDEENENRIRIRSRGATISNPPQRSSSRRPSTADSMNYHTPFSSLQDGFDGQRGHKKKHRRSLSERNNPESYPLSSTFFPPAPSPIRNIDNSIDKSGNTGFGRDKLPSQLQISDLTVADRERPLPPLPPPSASHIRHTFRNTLPTPYNISNNSNNKVDSIYIDLNIDSPRFDLLIPTPSSERRKKMERVWKILGNDVRVGDVFKELGGEDEDVDVDVDVDVEYDDEKDVRLESTLADVHINDLDTEEYKSTTAESDWDKIKIIRVERHRDLYNDSPTSSNSSSSASSSFSPSRTTALASSQTRTPLSSSSSTSASAKSKMLKMFGRMKVR